MRLLSRNVIVTGAAGGIGRACALEAASAGAKVALASRTRHDLQRVAREIRKAGGECLETPCDVSREEDVHLLFARVRDAWGTLDGLVNCAAVFEQMPVADLALDGWSRVLATNLTGTFLCCREAFRTMPPGGSIVNLGALSGVPGVEKLPGSGVYNVSKSGVLGLTEVLAVEGSARGLRVNCISPAAVASEWAKRAQLWEAPAITPGEVADVILFLLSDASRALNGANILVAGAPLGFPAPSPGRA